MRKFDLELAKAGHPVCTRDGKPVRIICFDVKGTDYPIVAAIMAGDIEYINQYPNSGKYYADGHESPGDLMMVSEVKDSDDEEVRKAILWCINTVEKELGCKDAEGLAIAKLKSWVEKQGEQTSTDKAEPKFKVGDYLVSDYCKGKVIALTDDAYLLDTEQGIPFSCEHNAHLWTIQDAKEGDVLAVENMIFIYKTILARHVVSYCELFEDRFGHFEYGRTCCEGNRNIRPATKEQRDLLFQKIKEAGYEWDAEKKELKKIEQTSAWSEEDERLFQIVIDILDRENHKGNISLTDLIACVRKLKSLKDKVQPQPKQEWKPSDEQIQALEYQVHSTYKGSWQYRASKELLEQLKKL